jgi:hypothetical protein
VVKSFLMIFSKRERPHDHALHRIVDVADLLILGVDLLVQRAICIVEVGGGAVLWIVGGCWPLGCVLGERSRLRNTATGHAHC